MAASHAQGFLPLCRHPGKSDGLWWRISEIVLTSDHKHILEIEIPVCLRNIWI
jgi:hypothetical protein